MVTGSKVHHTVNVSRMPISPVCQACQLWIKLWALFCLHRGRCSVKLPTNHGSTPCSFTLMADIVHAKIRGHLLGRA